MTDTFTVTAPSVAAGSHAHTAGETLPNQHMKTVGTELCSRDRPLGSSRDPRRSQGGRFRVEARGCGLRPKGRMITTRTVHKFRR